MRGLIRGVSTLFVVSLLLAFLHSCSHDDSILKPSCLIFEVDLNERWWYPQDNDLKPLYFRSNGLMKMEGTTDSLSFVLQHCNKLAVTNFTTDAREEWVIKSISDDDLQLRFPDDRVGNYVRRR